MSQPGGWRNLVEWGVVLLFVAAAVVALRVFTGKSPLQRGAGSRPAPRTIELFAQADPLDADRVAEVHVADVTVAPEGAAVLARCQDERLATQLQAVLTEMRRQPALALPVEEMRDDGLALGAAQVPPSDPRYVWAAARFLRLKTGLSYKVKEGP